MTSVATWDLLVTDTAGNELGELTAATLRVLTWNLDDSCTVTFTLPGDHDQAKLIEETATDLIVLRNGTRLFRGRFGPSTDTLGADVTEATAATGPKQTSGYDSTFTATCYRGMLARRFLWPGSTATFTDVDQASIVSTLVEQSEALGGGWGISTAGIAATGVTRQRSYNTGVALGTTITDLGDTVGGFDWEVDGNLDLNLYYPARGQVGEVSLDYGGLIVTVARTVDTSVFANAVLATGAATLEPVTDVPADFGPAGRWEQTYSDPDILDQPTLEQRAGFYLAYADDAPATYQCVLRGGWWSPDAFWLGDVVRLYIRRGRLNVDAAVRATQFVVNLGDAGGEFVTVTLGPVLVVRADNTVPAGSSTGTALTTADALVQSPALTGTSPLKLLLDHDSILGALQRPH